MGSTQGLRNDSAPASKAMLMAGNSAASMIWNSNMFPTYAKPKSLSRGRQSHDRGGQHRTRPLIRQI